LTDYWVTDYQTNGLSLVHYPTVSDYWAKGLGLGLVVG